MEFQWTLPQIITLLILTGIMIVPLLFSKYRTRNIFGIMVIYFIFEPLAFTVFMVFLLSILIKNHYVVGIALFVLVPIGCVFWLLMDQGDIHFLKRAKVALEWNQAIATGISIFVGICIILVSKSDLMFLNSVFPEEVLQQDDLTFRDIFNFLFLIISFPFVVGFAISKAYIEHLLYRAEKNQASIKIENGTFQEFPPNA